MAKCKFLLLGLVIFMVQLEEHQGCHEEERRSLLEFKAYVHSKGFDAPSWDEDDPDCCRWERVKCANNNTGHVIELSLNNVADVQSLLNLSIFQSFKQLRVLDLSSNGFTGWTNRKEEGNYCYLINYHPFN